ncbi:MAG: 6,7-dimethyl-8-ribityllumazine synthase [Patescibacteria group bacterium]
MKTKNIGIIAAQFHKEISETMLRKAEGEVKSNKGNVGDVIRVPGCFEIPLAAKRLLSKKSIDAVVVLGYIEKGETLHGEVMGHVVYRTLMQLQLEFMKPIGYGIIGPGATEAQARKRMKSAARNAVRVLFTE